MNDLAEFLTARLDEDEQVAQKSDPTDVKKWDYLLWARFSRARVLADIDAKRRIIDLHSGSNDEPCQSEAGNYTYEPCLTLRLLALPYADHADYDGTWRP